MPANFQQKLFLCANYYYRVHQMSTISVVHWMSSSFRMKKVNAKKLGFLQTMYV